ncbi:MAG: putative dynein heavy chain [Streblomastix strix]|uniref:Putative dynein heavy chain n=1 Tax=Streblomastix strix TaxID=222440 RepID=A0A5J4QST1_9EUKA|nr:MAG: putative dynein heavy chain [Streblomastix strix]
MNTPTPEIYFAQPPIELIRQCVTQYGVYDRKKLTFIHLTDTAFAAACGPPGGGRHEVTRRLTRQFPTIGMPQVGAQAMTTVYSFIIVGFLSNQKPSLPATVQELAQPLVDAAAEIYQETCSTFLPTPSKSHYTFNLRDSSSLISGVLHSSSGYQSSLILVKLWAHERCRVFRVGAWNDAIVIDDKDDCVQPERAVTI